MGDSNVGRLVPVLVDGDALRAQRGNESERSGCRSCGGEIGVIAKGLGRQRPEHMRPAAEPERPVDRPLRRTVAQHVHAQQQRANVHARLRPSGAASTVRVRQAVTMRPAEGVGAFRSLCSWGLFLWTAVANRQRCSMNRRE